MISGSVIHGTPLWYPVQAGIRRGSKQGRSAVLFVFRRKNKTYGAFLY